jgi:hypothetical protein
VRLISLAFCIFLLAGCASRASRETPPLVALESFKCKVGEFRGSGTGTNEAEALNAARSELAMQISSSVEVSQKSRQGQRVLNDKETIDSEFDSETIVKSMLINAHDARILHSGPNSVVVCMSRADAAKGFEERQRLIADSLEIVSHVEMGTEHPKRKNDAWRKTKNLWNEFMKIQKLLEGWGIERNEFLEPTSKTYSKTKEDYKSYCVKQKTYWKDTENDCSKVVFSELSKRIKIEKSECASGLNLRFSCSEKCEASSYGVECAFEPSLAIESCNGELYSLQKIKEPVRGSDMYNSGKAKENLIKNLSAADFFREWEKDIKEWVPQCED